MGLLSSKFRFAVMVRIVMLLCLTAVLLEGVPSTLAGNIVMDDQRSLPADSMSDGHMAPGTHVHDVATSGKEWRSAES